MMYSDWEIIETLYQEKNITSAATKLYLTQPALTYRIKALEQELHTTLFIRTHSGLLFTSEGLVVVQYAKEMLSRYKELLNMLSQMDSVVRGEINIAVSRAFADSDLVESLSYFIKSQPHIRVKVINDASTKCVEKLMNNEVHVAVVRGEHHVNCKSILISEDPITLISKKPIEIKQLTEIPYIKYVTDITLEHEIISWWNEHFRSAPKAVISVNDSHACRKMVEEGIGFTILPSAAFGKMEPKEFSVEELVHKNGQPLIR